MSIIIWLVIIFFLLLTFWMYRSRHPVARILFYVMSVVSLLVVLMSGLVLYDVKEFNQNFPVSKNIFVLKDQSGLITAIESNPEVADATRYFTGGEIEELKAKYNSAPESMSEDYYKALVYDLSVFENMPEFEILIGEDRINKSFAVSILRSNIPRDLLTNHIISSRNISYVEEVYDSIKIQLKSDSYVKQLVFGLMSNEFLVGNVVPKFALVLEIKKGNIIIYPKTILFKFIDYVPGYLIDQALSTVEK